MRRRGLIGLAVLAVALLLVVPSAAGFYTDWLWFRELGYEGVFLRTLNAQAHGLRRHVRWPSSCSCSSTSGSRARTCGRPHIVLGTAADGRPIVDRRREGWRASRCRSRWSSRCCSRSSASRDWLSWLSFFNAVPFGAADPLFGRDVAFYVFRLPICETLRQQALVVVVPGARRLRPATTCCRAASSSSRGYGVAFWPRMRLVPSARRHLALLGGACLRAAGLGRVARRARSLLLDAGRPSSSARRTPTCTRACRSLRVDDRRARRRRGAGDRGTGFGAARLAAAAGGRALPRRVDRRRHLRRPRPALRRHAERARQGAAVHPSTTSTATRRAFALDRVEERELSGDAELHRQDIIANADTIENVRLWDHQPLLQTFGADSGNPDLLRLRSRRQRPLHDRRQVPAGDAVGARAEHRAACRTARGSTSA